MKKRCNRAQVSMEYIIIVGFIMVLIVPLLLIFYNFQGESTDTIVSNQISQVGKKVVDTAETIYFLGEPSKTNIRVYLPEKIQSVEISTRELVFNVSTRAGTDQVVFLSTVNMTGTLPTTAGLHVIEIESLGASVQITTT